MATRQYTYQTRYLAATPRNKRLTEGIQSAAQSGGGGIGYIPSSGPQYWQLVTTDTEGNSLPEEQYYLTPVSGVHLHMPGDVVAYATAPFDQLEPQLPVASDYNTTGLFRAKQGGGLLYDSAANAWYVDSDFQGGGGGIDEEQLYAYLTNNKYVTQKYLTDNGYLKLSSPLTGYEKPTGYTPITATDTLLSAIGKLEANFGNYVDLITNQTVGGIKTFTERILSQKDVVCYASADEGDLGLPVTGYSTTGLVRIQQGGGIVVDSSGTISIDPDYAGGGGVSFTPGAALELTSGGVLNVLIGTTSGTVCAGNDSRLTNDRPNPYSLSWSGFSNGSYDGSSVKSFVIPNNTNQLTNGAGFIKDGNGNFTTLSGSGSSSKYLAGNGTFYTIAYSELSGAPDLSVYVTLNTKQTITAQKTFTERVWFNGVGILYAGPSSNVHLVIGSGSGNVINGYTSSGSIGNIYMNYRSGSQFTRIDGNNNFQTSGDIVAYSTGSTLSDFVPVATTSTYGLVKYDGSTIGKNSSGQLYVIGGTGGGGGDGGVTSVTVSGSGNAVTSASISGTTLTLTKGTSFASAVTTSGSGNAVTSVSKSGGTITFTKGSTFSLSNHTHSNYLTSLSRSTSGSGGVVTNVTVSGSTITVYFGSASSGSWSGGTITSAIYKSSGDMLTANSGGCNFCFTPDYSDAKFYVAGKSGTSDKHFQFYRGSTKLCQFGTTYMQTCVSWTVSSDLRKKQIVSYLDNVLDTITSVNVIRFTRIDLETDRVFIGVGAQQVKGLFPEIVAYDSSSDEYSVDYAAMAPIAFQGLKELYARFRPVENRVKVLEQQVRNLQLRLDNAYREIFNLKQGKEVA